MISPAYLCRNGYGTSTALGVTKTCSRAAQANGEAAWKKYPGIPPVFHKNRRQHRKAKRPLPNRSETYYLHPEKGEGEDAAQENDRNSLGCYSFRGRRSSRTLTGEFKEAFGRLRRTDIDACERLARRRARLLQKAWARYHLCFYIERVGNV